jgi:hypothetical protein
MDGVYSVRKSARRVPELPCTKYISRRTAISTDPLD